TADSDRPASDSGKAARSDAKGKAAKAAKATEAAGTAEAPQEAEPKVARGFEAPASGTPRTGEQSEKSEKAETRGGRRKRPAPPVAMFQPPVFTEPAFQTPQSAAAAAEAERRAEAEAETEPEPETETGAAIEEEAAATPRRRRRRRAESAEQQAAEQQPAARDESRDEREDREGGDQDTEGEEQEGAQADERPARRRRRGGRRRRRGESAEQAEGAESDEADEPEEREERPEAAEETETAGRAAADAAGAGEDEGEAGATGGTSSSSSRRRRRRRRRSGDTEAPAGETVTSEDPERTVVKVREPRKKKDEPSDEVQAIKGSTRLEAKKQRRREGREQGRRRVPIITEAEFLARREAVKREMIVRQSGERTQIAVLEDDVLVEHFVNKEQSTSYVGNVYLGKVQNVLPSMEAAFVDIGKGRNAVLYAGEVNFESLGMGNGPRRIETALKSGQSVLVQVTKDPIGHKGARLTSQVSLPGRYLVYVPEGSMTGISRKLPDTERSRLKQILKRVVPEGAGVIVRTAAEGASEDELRRDVERLQAQWEDIQKKAQKGNAPTLLYGEPDMTVRVVRDIFNEDFSKVTISGDEAWETIHGYVSHVAPDLGDRLQKWTSDVDVFATYRIDEQLAKALDRKVWLPSGGSLVIDRTEAMIVVDVNTGKFTGQGGNLEETVTRNNLEAAEEIVRQLRLRDLGGIIVIDFIDMVLESNRDLVLRRLLECLGRDRTKHQVAEVTSLGLVQMTRKRVGQGLLESFSEQCVHCNGRGVIVHMDQAVAAGAGGGGKKGKKGKGKADKGEAKGGGQQVAQPQPAPAEPVPAEPEPSPATAPAAAAVEPSEVVAESADVSTAAPAPVEFVPDEELFNSAAEAEAAAAAARGGRGRRRGSRKASAPAGSPRATAGEAAEVVEPTTPEPAASESAVSQPAVPEAVAVGPAAVEPTAPAPAEAPAEPTADVAAPVAEPSTEQAAEQPAEQPEAATEPATGARRRRRVTRKVSAPAGAPRTGDGTAAVLVVPSDEATAPAAAAEPEPVVGEVVTDVAPVRPRRRVTRTITTTAPAEEGEAVAPAKKTAAKKAAKKAPAKKTAAKKTAAKKSTTAKSATKAAGKSAAGKTAANKTAAKKAAKKASAKKTAAAEQEGGAGTSVSAATPEE
ncbi:ribonuclease E/G, partial [Streptomyces smyrnaeus]|uniref:ribonuclease E/G n=1 Tax=Streptomyces smyrnaeus TaxID=1387713 RepID=UPI003687D6E5